MRAVIQRVSEAKVSVEGKTSGEINNGLLILLGVEIADKQEDMNWLVQKIASLRIFSDAEGKMNLSVTDIKGEILVVSQFTLLADSKKGNRPSFIRAARPEQAMPFYEMFCEKLHHVSSCKIARGVFGADMQVRLVNEGPVTLVLDSRVKDF